MQAMRMMRAGYGREGDRKFEVDAHRSVAATASLDHPAVDPLRAGKEVRLGVDGYVPMGGHEINVPALGRVVGTIRSMSDERMRG